MSKIKIIKVKCCGRIHKIAKSRNGAIRFLNHTAEELKVGLATLNFNGRKMRCAQLFAMLCGIGKESDIGELQKSCPELLPNKFLTNFKMLRINKKFSKILRKPNPALAQLTDDDAGVIKVTEPEYIYGVRDSDVEKSKKAIKTLIDFIDELKKQFPFFKWIVDLEKIKRAAVCFSINQVFNARDAGHRWSKLKSILDLIVIDGELKMRYSQHWKNCDASLFLEAFLLNYENRYLTNANCLPATVENQIESICDVSKETQSKLVDQLINDLVTVSDPAKSQQPWCSVAYSKHFSLMQAHSSESMWFLQKLFPKVQKLLKILVDRRERRINDLKRTARPSDIFEEIKDQD